MNAAKRHVPGFAFDGRDPPEPWIEFTTVAELLLIPFIAEWRKPTGGRNFHRYSLADKNLMVEYDEGFYWWVVAYLREPVDDLPKWEARTEVLDNGVVREVSKGEIFSTSGETAKMRDGRELQLSGRSSR